MKVKRYNERQNLQKCDSIKDNLFTVVICGVDVGGCHLDLLHISFKRFVVVREREKVGSLKLSGVRRVVFRKLYLCSAERYQNGRFVMR